MSDITKTTAWKWVCSVCQAQGVGIDRRTAEWTLTAHLELVHDYPQLNK